MCIYLFLCGIVLSPWGGGEQGSKKKKMNQICIQPAKSSHSITEISHKQNTSNKVISATAEVHVTCVGIKRRRKISAGFLKENSVV